MAEKGRRCKMKNQRFSFKNLFTKAMKEEIENKNSQEFSGLSVCTLFPLKHWKCSSLPEAFCPVLWAVWGITNAIWLPAQLQNKKENENILWELERVLQTQILNSSLCGSNWHPEPKNWLSTARDFPCWNLVFTVQLDPETCCVLPVGSEACVFLYSQHLAQHQAPSVHSVHTDWTKERWG